MKKIALFFLFISMIFSSAFARNDNNINLKIGGISLFDDLHDHLTAKQIREKIKGNENYYIHLKKPFQFPTVTVENHALINKKYKNVEINYENNKGKFVVHSISAGEFYTDINLCFEDLRTLVENVTFKYSNLKKEGPFDFPHPGDPSGKSKIKQYLFTGKNSEIEISCYDWSDEITNNKGYADNLAFGINSIKFSNWMLDVKW